MAVIALGACIAANVVAIITDIAALPLLDDVTDIDALNRFDNLTGSVGILEFLALVAGAVCFIRWFNLIHRGLDKLSPGVRRYDTWWSIGGWFIPIWGLFRPKQILDDMLAAANGRDTAHPWWAPTWWALWIIGSFGGNVAGRAFFNADTLDALRGATIADAVSSAILVAGGAVAIVVVRQLTEAIQRKEREVQATPAMAPLGPEPPAQLAGESAW